MRLGCLVGIGLEHTSQLSSRSRQDACDTSRWGLDEADQLAADLIERTLAEEALREGEERFAARLDPVDALSRQ